MKWNPFRRAERRNLTIDWDRAPTNVSGNVTTDQALRLGPVYAAGRLLADNIAAMPLQQYRRKSDDTHERLPLASLFSSPSTQGNLHDWVYRAVTSLAYRGNAIGYIANWDAQEFPTTIEWLNPDWVQVLDTAVSGPGSFTNPIWYVLGRPTPPERLVHIPWFVMPGRIWGLSPLGAYAATVSTGLSAQQFASQWFTNGGVPPATFQNSTQEVDQEKADAIKKMLVQAIRTHAPLVYGKDWQYTPISVGASEAKFVDTMRLTASQIAAIYGIPPELIGGETGGSLSYSSPEQRQIELVQFTLLPWLTKLESHFSSLLPGGDGRVGQYVKFDVDALIRTDIFTRWSVYAVARSIGAISNNEIRARENMPPIPGGDDYTPFSVKAPTAPAAPSMRDVAERLRLVGNDE